MHHFQLQLNLLKIILQLIGIMTTEYISLDVNTPVKEALMLVKEQAPDAETIHGSLTLAN
jgi:hypothetical protein